MICELNEYLHLHAPRWAESVCRHQCNKPRKCRTTLKLRSTRPISEQRRSPGGRKEAVGGQQSGQTMLKLPAIRQEAARDHRTAGEALAHLQALKAAQNWLRQCLCHTFVANKSMPVTVSFQSLKFHRLLHNVVKYLSTCSNVKVARHHRDQPIFHREPEKATPESDRTNTTAAAAAYRAFHPNSAN